MKQKTTDQSPDTENRLKIILKKEFETYDQKFTNRLLTSQEAFRKEIDRIFEMLDERWERRFTAFESRLITLIDPILQEIKTRQLEREIVTGQISETRDRIDNHEKRIAKLEHA